MNLTKTLALGFAAVALMLVALFFALEAWLTMFGLPVWQSLVLVGVFVVSAKISQRASNNALQAEADRLIDEALDRLRPSRRNSEETEDGQP